ncbi:MAG: T9SS type A sorting domain-containing protein [Chitinophagaceae bacterium]|nr:T9SS type A sorting domain-containing protein [Chitinophagaceae bacterium]
MKRLLPIFTLLFFCSPMVKAQITSPVIRGNFGVDADLRSNYYNGLLQAGNDDWYHFPGTAGIGQFVIDTTGAAGIVARYSTDVAFRRTTFARTMRYPAYSVVNNRTLLDAILVRDFHGDDSTVFASGSNKNGDNPIDWSTPVSQGIPDKNDILDMFVHVRRAGPNGTDSLWLFGGLSLDNTTGNRYFDFEMYQTDFYYDRANLEFGGYGPDAGHTSWEFDASGNITRAGDIILSAEYQSSSLSFIEARIWIHKSKLSISPAAFSWSGNFDGASAGAMYGYASIQPKTAGTYYTGLQCANNTWGGPFGIVLQNDVVATNYDAKQFVELSVNLTKLGLDPLTRLGGDPCGMPFRKVLVKTRASASFTAELKDFVAPFAFFDPPRAAIVSETPYLCAQGSVAQIHVTNPLITSSYTWTTPNGNIVSGANGTTIVVDTPGTYIVTQHLLASCGAYATDTVQILPFAPCEVLNVSLFDFQGVSTDFAIALNWKVTDNQLVSYFIIERSWDGTHFESLGEIRKTPSSKPIGSYNYKNDIRNAQAPSAYYRVRLVSTSGTVKVSNTIRFTLGKLSNQIVLFPNPAKDIVQVQVSATFNGKMKTEIFDPAGRLISVNLSDVSTGMNVISLQSLIGTPPGIYMAVIRLGSETFRQKIVVVK